MFVAPQDFESCRLFQVKELQKNSMSVIGDALSLANKYQEATLPVTGPGDE